jgi:hypothetical protein
MKRLFLVAFMLTLLVALAWRCERETFQPVRPEADATIERLIFGRYNSFCSGRDCADYFLLEDGLLYADMDDYQRKPFPVRGDWQALTKEEYGMATVLLTTLPEEIWRSEHDVFGAPDAYDQGGYYLEVSLSSGVHRFWLLDTEYEALPEFLRTYTKTMVKVMGELEAYD